LAILRLSIQSWPRPVTLLVSGGDGANRKRERIMYTIYTSAGLWSSPKSHRECAKDLLTMHNQGMTATCIERDGGIDVDINTLGANWSRAVTGRAIGDVANALREQAA